MLTMDTLICLASALTDAIKKLLNLFWNWKQTFANLASSPCCMRKHKTAKDNNTVLKFKFSPVPYQLIEFGGQFWADEDRPPQLIKSSFICFVS